MSNYDPKDPRGWPLQAQSQSAWNLQTQQWEQLPPTHQPPAPRVWNPRPQQREQPQVQRQVPQHTVQDSWRHQHKQAQQQQHHQLQQQQLQAGHHQEQSRGWEAQQQRWAQKSKQGQTRRLQAYGSTSQPQISQPSEKPQLNMPLSDAATTIWNAGESNMGWAGGAAAASVVDGAVEPNDNSAGPIDAAVATQGAKVRVSFIKKTYAHLAGAILLFTGLEFFLFEVQVGKELAIHLTNFVLAGRFNWLAFFGLFVVASWVAGRWAKSATTRKSQYLCLLLYSVAVAIIFLPLLFIVAVRLNVPELIAQAGVISVALFGAITAVIVIARKDFSVLKSALVMGTIIAGGAIIAGLMHGFTLGIPLGAGTVVLVGGFVLIYTSRVLASYHPQQYVAAALALFSAIALLFWYFIKILIEKRK